MMTIDQILACIEKNPHLKAAIVVTMFLDILTACVLEHGEGEEMVQALNERIDGMTRQSPNDCIRDWVIQETVARISNIIESEGCDCGSHD